jgi:hypothetical protein
MICCVPVVLAGKTVRWSVIVGRVTYGIQLASRKSEKRLTRYSVGVAPDTVCTRAIVKLEAFELVNTESNGV